MQIYVDHAGQRFGPFSVDDLNRELALGRVSATDHAWWEGVDKWAPVAQVPGVILSANAANAPGVRYVAVPSLPVRASEPLAVWSFVLGLLGLLGSCCGGVLLCIASVICGHIALSHIKADPTREGRGLAIAGLVLSYITIAGLLIYLLFFGGLAALSALSEGARRH